MNVSEKILLKFCKKNNNVQQTFKEDISSDKLALKQIQQHLKAFDSLIKYKKIVDFGSGFGHQAFELNKQFNCSVLGLEIDKNKLSYSHKRRIKLQISKKIVNFKNTPSNDDFSKYDLVISLNSFEHFNNPEFILDQMIKLVNENGSLIISFGPPWFAPFGAHMNFFCKLPWIQFLFSEKTVLNVRKLYRNDGATKYTEVSGGLNQMSFYKFEKLIMQSRLKIIDKKHTAIKKLNFLTIVPILREFFINQITVVLQKI